MEPLIALVVGFVGARLAGLAGVDALDAWHPALRVGLALMFLVTAFAHFHPRYRADLIGMVPPVLPGAGALVTVTGVFEIAGAVGLLVPATSRAAAACLIALMVAMYFANVSAARRQVAQGDPIVARTALQLLFMTAAALVVAQP